MGKTIKQYEWDNRLGTVAHQLRMQGRSLRDFKGMFHNKLDAVSIELLDKLANSSEQLGTMVRELEDEIHGT